MNELREAVAQRIPQETVKFLRSEATRQQFIHYRSPNYGIKPEERRITSPFDFATAAADDAAQARLDSPEVRRLGAALVGKEIIPTTCSYLLYRSGAYIGLHTDRPDCEVNILVLLAGPPTVAEFRPLGAGETVRDLLDLSRQGNGFVDSTVHVQLNSPGDAVLFLAMQLPHQRRPADAPLLLVNLCYATIPRA